MFTTTLPITARADGSFVVEHNGNPYQVVSREIDPHNAYDLAEVVQFAQEHPELVHPDGPRLVDVVSELCVKIDAAIPGLRKAGFEYQGMNYQADPGVTEAVNGVLTAMTAGVPVQFPIPWRSGDNQRPAWADADSFKAFGGYLLSFVQGLYSRAWEDKDAIISATTVQEAQDIFDHGPWGLVE